MKYLVKAKLKEASRQGLLQAIEDETLGTGSVAFGEYIKNMKQARVLDDGTVCWVEICFCPTPLNEERSYWEEYFDIIAIENVQNPKLCKDSNGSQKRGCFECSCTDKLEREMESWGKPFVYSTSNQ